MKSLYAFADWVATLNPFALAGITCLVLAALACMALGAALIYFAAASGAGEPHPEEAGETEEDAS